MLLPAPSADLLRTQRYDEFREMAAEYFRGIHPAELIDRVVPEDLAAIRWHPSRFMVVHLTPPEERAKGQLRLHIWPEGIDRCDTDIHSHPWDLAAKVITGSYVEYQPQVSLARAEERPAWVSIGSRHEPDNPDRVHLTLGRQVGVDMGGLSVYEAGEMHTLPAGVFHQTPVSGKALVTVALMGANYHPSEYLRPLGEAPPAIERPRGQVSLAELRRAYEIIHQSAATE